MTSLAPNAAPTGPAVPAVPADGPLRLLHDLGTRYVVLRPSRGPDDDLDLLVHPDDLGDALAGLASLGLVEEPAHGRGTHRFLLGLLEGRFVRLDLVTTLDFGPLTTWPSGMAAGCLRRATVDADGTSRPARRDEFWVTVLHLLADDGTDPRTSDRLDRVVALADTLGGDPGEDWHRVVSRLLPRSVSPADLVRGCASGDAGPARELLVALRPAVRRRVLTGALAAHGGRFAVTTVLRATEPLRQWRGRRGLLVAVLGPDGAGKSTLLAAVEDAWPWPSRCIYFGLWPDAHGAGRAARALWPLRRPCRAVARHAAGRLQSARGRLVLFDRYVYDAAAPPRGDHLLLKRCYFGLLLRSVPAPDVAVLLEAPGEVLHARKGEMTPRVLDANREAISRHVHAVRRRTGRPLVLVVDATQSREAVADQVVAALWRSATDRLLHRTEGEPR